MAFCISTTDMACIGCLADAARHWGTKTPWKNRDETSRQLGSRRAFHKRLVKQSLGHTPLNYQCVLYNTAVVTYFINGNVALRCHDSNSTKAFSWCVRPSGCQPVSNRGRMFWQVETDDGPCYYREDKEPLLLQPTAKGNWLLISKPAIEHEWQHDRKKAVQVRKQLKPYILWYNITKRLNALPPRQPRSYGVNVDIVAALLAHTNTELSYNTVATIIGPPEEILPTAYKLAGANFKTSVPYNRLPRNSA